MERPGQIAVAPDGTLWIMQRGEGAKLPRILHLTSSGTLLPESVSFASSMRPRGFCIDNRNRLFVADSGVANNIKIYDSKKLSGSPTRVQSVFGAQGGVFSGVAGAIGLGRFHEPVAVGRDDKNNIYVCSNTTTFGSGGTIESYDLTTQKRDARWPKPLYGLLWLDSADVDPDSDSDFYSGDKHFVFDFNEKTSGGGWTFKGLTCNPFKYPQDARACMKARLRLRLL